MKPGTALGALLLAAAGTLAGAPFAAAAHPTTAASSAADDGDGDGVADADDGCPTTAAESSSGCPVADRTVTMVYRKGVFRGVLSSSVGRCVTDSAVPVYRRLQGADPRIGTGFTGDNGQYRVKEARDSGTYYATSRRLVVPDVAECPAVRSSNVKIG
jgi:hypothetical protein